MDQASIYILLAGALGLFMAWGIGANDVANAVGPMAAVISIANEGVVT